MKIGILTKKLSVLVGVVALLLIAGMANAANVHMIRGSSSGSTNGTSTFDWSSDSAWDDGHGVNATNATTINALNDYWVGRDENGNRITTASIYYSLRPPSNTTFYGKSLHVITSTVSFRPGNNTSYTLPNCFMTSSSFNNQASPGGTPSLSAGIVNGKVTGQGGNLTLSASSGGRQMTYNCLFTGSITNMNITMSRTTNANGTSDTTFLTNALNDISGTTISQNGGKLVPSGTGTMGNFSKFTCNSIFAPAGIMRLPNTDVILTSISRVQMDAHIQVKSLKVGNTVLAPGIYTAANLATSFTYPVNGIANWPVFVGTSTLTVGTEPNAINKGWQSFN